MISKWLEFCTHIGLFWTAMLMFAATIPGIYLACEAERLWASRGGWRAWWLAMKRGCLRATLPLHTEGEIAQIAARRNLIDAGPFGPPMMHVSTGEADYRALIEAMECIPPRLKERGYELRTLFTGHDYVVIAMSADDVCVCRSRSQFRATVTAACLATA